MKEKTYMTISEFAHITGIKRANLIFYDNVGLLPPEYRGSNDYRYYSSRQLSSAYLIMALRELGLGLKEISEYAGRRTPERMLGLMDEQDTRIQKEINRLHRMKDMMGIYKDMTKEVLQWNMDEIIVRQQEKAPIFLGDTFVTDANKDEASIQFYEYATSKGLETGYPLGSMIAQSIVEAGMKELETPRYQFYFRVKHGHNTYKPKGQYAVACGYCAYGESAFVYEKVLNFINREKLSICGAAFEEYPINEMAVQDDSKYCVKIEIMVR